METKLFEYQVPHLDAVLSALLKYRSALDASDTGTGKTYVALHICKKLDIVPLVVGPKGARAGWEDAAKRIGVDIEYVNYERVRPRIYEQTLGRCPRCPETGKPFLGPFLGTPRHYSEWAEEFAYGSGSYIKWLQEYTLIIFDEVHRCGGSKSLNSKLLIAARRQAQYVLALSATAADDPRQMKALGFALGLHQLNTIRGTKSMSYMSWLLRHGVTPGVWGGFDFTTVGEKQKKVFTKLHHEIFPAHGARMRKAEIPGFPQTQVLVKLLTDETGKAAALSEELHDLDEEGVQKNLEEVIRCRQGLELLKIKPFIELSEEWAMTSKVVLFVNFTETLWQLFEGLKAKFGNSRVGYISGAQVGDKGYTERVRFIDSFQRNKLEALVVNIFAGGESINLHDPLGEVERTTGISPCDSGRQYKQLLGRVNRAGGAYSIQYCAFFKDTREEPVAERMFARGCNIDLLNDADLLI
jgi:hypothetical protein